jgi:hypothetical protein
MQQVLRFFELGLVIFAWMLFWSWLTKGLCARYPDNPLAQGTAALLHV